MSDLIERLWDSDAAKALTNEAAREIEAQQAEIARLRAALISSGHAAGAGLTDDVTTDFPMGVPDEVRLKIEEMSAQPSEQEGELGIGMAVEYRHWR